ncbi:bifunctional adenosylcobinamide kinase/adenosylcobinamide-phosphate guanylyltransferase [Paractinoplanes atraurantiacus]|uniref:Adenosylcobinamide kinase n=1 Tax=Paractinoplanes atraurantiacus TaxID=1036182 RepID=A0A285HBX9_9ACTN|nr:bifunctional adenosylcobinamide kinase/adenosylcobinamide-phosphate guanylyltransferase [Actinoplanes atraurantiacus]SNY33248.1 Adenosyl cobinamide kinase/adenosyl cobinamide phosphate guanylyltransferase [Actinoplanes atraurantiacus]
MSDDRWHTVLVLGGIRSGKSEFAESLVADAPAVRYVATAVGGEDDPEWLERIETHQRRRPQAWSTEETGADPSRLTELLTEAKPGDTLLVDDLGGWVAALLDPARQPNDDEADVAALAAAVRDCEARVVLVSPEVGLTLVPTTPVGRAFADALGTTNQALAQACDGVALVVAGQAVWLKTADVRNHTTTEPQPTASTVHDVVTESPAAPAPAATPVATTPAASVTETIQPPPVIEPQPAATPLARVLDEPTMSLPAIGARPVFEPGMDLPLPDTETGPEARERLATVDFPGSGLGALVGAVEFAAATQSTVTPQPWSSLRVLLLSGRHAGGAGAGDDVVDVERRVAQVENGEGVLSRLAGAAGADIAILRTGESTAMEAGPVLTDDEVEHHLQTGWQLAEAAADAGKDLLVLASIGVGTDAVAAAVTAATTGAEAVAILPRVLLPGGVYDDESWMRRAAAVRDALHRIRREPRGAKDLLRELGGADTAIAVGALLGATAKKLPVLIDGPLGIAAGLIARDLGSQAKHWCLLADSGGLHLVKEGGDFLGLNPVLDLGLGLGEGANALATLPLLRTAIGLAGTVAVHPAMLSELGDGGASDLIVPNDDDVDFAEPEPDGPGPASTTE